MILYERNGENNIEKSDRVKIIGLPKEAFATVIRKGHKNHWIINIDGDAKPDLVMGKLNAERHDHFKDSAKALFFLLHLFLSYLRKQMNGGLIK